jgi:hypothetical protein
MLRRGKPRSGMVRCGKAWQGKVWRGQYKNKRRLHMAQQAIPFTASSHITEPVTYDPDTRELIVSFGKNSYSYAGVPQDVVDGFSAAPSAGSYLHASIKGKYETTKL